MDNYQFTILYKAGKENGGADGLSRMPHEDMKLEESQEETMEWPVRLIRMTQIAQWVKPEDQDLDPSLQLVKSALSANPNDPEHQGFSVKDNLLFHSDQEGAKLVIPEKLKLSIMQELHDSYRGGHFGIRKTRKKIQQRFFWKGLTKDVKEYVQSCQTCQETKAPKSTNVAPLKPLNPTGVWSLITSDFLGPFEKTEDGNLYILVFIDHVSKWAVAFATPDQRTETVAECFIKLTKQYGIPDSLLTDQGRSFEAQLYQELLEVLDVKKLRTTPYHPESDGLSERFNRTLLQLLRSYGNDHKKNWDTLLDQLVFTYNTTTHDTTNATPFEIMFGRKPKIPIDLCLPEINLEIEMDYEDATKKVKENFRMLYDYIDKHTDLKVESMKLNHDRQIRCFK